MEVVASLSQGRTAAAQCGLFTHKSVPVIFEPPCTNGYADVHSKTQTLEERQMSLGRRNSNFIAAAPTLKCEQRNETGCGGCC